jgi:hypothetical protein
MLGRFLPCSQALTLATHNEIGDAFPSDLIDALTEKRIPGDYLPRIAPGAGSEIWARLAVQKAYDPKSEMRLFNAVLLTREPVMVQ